VYQRHNYFEDKRAALGAWAREVKRLTRLGTTALGETRSRKTNGARQIQPKETKIESESLPLAISPVLA